MPNSLESPVEEKLDLNGERIADGRKRANASVEQPSFRYTLAD